MRGRTLLTILLALMICVPVQGSSSSMAAEEKVDPCEEDPKQPCDNRTILFLYSNGYSTFWSHFNSTEDNNIANNEWQQEKDQGVISIDERFTMNPQMSKRLNITLDGEVKVVLNIFLEGDWTNNDSQGPCQQDCDELNITLWAGATQVFRQHVPGVSAGWNTVMFTYRIVEGQELWDASTANPSLQIEMKVKGDFEQTIILVSGSVANFSMRLSGDGDTRIELPIDDSSWSKEFQTGDEVVQPVEQPGFLFVTAIAAMTIAAVYVPSRKDDSENR